MIAKKIPFAILIAALLAAVPSCEQPQGSPPPSQGGNGYGIDPNPGPGNDGGNNGGVPRPPMPIGSPQNLTIDENLMLRWDPVRNATGFRIYYRVGTSLQTRTLGNVNEFNLVDLNLGFASHDIALRALSSIEGFSDSIQAWGRFTITPTETDRFAMPENLNIDDNNILTFTSCGNAELYYVYVGEKRFFAIQNGFDLTQLGLSAGSHDISLRATSNPEHPGTSSPRSESVSWYVPETQLPYLVAQADLHGKIVGFGAQRAVGFNIIIRGNTINAGPFEYARNVPVATGGEFDLSILNLRAGTFTIDVQAIADPLLNRNPAPVRAGELTIEPTPLATPQNLRVTGSTLAWTQVPNAGSFILLVNGAAVQSLVIPGNATQFDLAGLGLVAGNHTISLRAMAAVGTDFTENEHPTVAQGQFVIQQIPQQVYDFFARMQVAGFDLQPGATLAEARAQAGQRGLANSANATWGVIQEFMIAQYIRHHETNALTPLPPITVAGVPALEPRFPSVLNLGTLASTGEPLSFAGVGNVTQNLPLNNRLLNTHSGPNDTTIIMPGFNAQQRFINDSSFAPATMIATAMIIHEEFVRNGLGPAETQIHQKPDGDFALIPLESINRAREFHLQALRNMHADINFYHLPDETPLTNVHNVFDFLRYFGGISNRFTNNPDYITNPIFGLGFNENGFPAGSKLGRCAYRVLREGQPASGRIAGTSNNIEDADFEVL